MPCAAVAWHGVKLGAKHKGRPQQEGGEGSPKADIVREVAWI